MYIVKQFEIVFSLISRTPIYAHVNIILDFPITYSNALALCQSNCACLHKTVNIAVVLLKVMKIPIQRGKSTHVNIQRYPSNEISEYLVYKK